MRDDLKKREDALIEDIKDGLKERASTFAEEHDAHLTAAIKKYVNFSKKGGEVDYIQPPEQNVEVDDDEFEENASSYEQITGLRELITEIRSIQRETLLLANIVDEDEDEA